MCIDLVVWQGWVGLSCGVVSPPCVPDATLQHTREATAACEGTNIVSTVLCSQSPLHRLIYIMWGENYSCNMTEWCPKSCGFDLIHNRELTDWPTPQQMLWRFGSTRGQSKPPHSSPSTLGLSEKVLMIMYHTNKRNRFVNLASHCHTKWLVLNTHCSMP